MSRHRQPIVMFGNGLLARTLLYYLDQESDFDVVAVTVDRERLADKRAIDLPTVAFDEIAEHYPPATHGMIVALGYSGMNRLRQERYTAAKAMGYQLVSHISPRASVWPDLEVGDNCLLLDEVIVHPYARIGNNTIIWSGSHIGHGSSIGDNCFIASRAAVSGWVTVGDNCFLGTNCTIRDGVRLAPMTLVGAGATVTNDTVEAQILASPQPRVLPGRSDRLPRF